ATPDRSRVLVWHANYHPDGGQLFFPRQKIPYIVPLALPGDDIAPERFTGFYCDGSFGIYFHPGVWHTPALPLAPAAELDDRQGRARGGAPTSRGSSGRISRCRCGRRSGVTNTT